MLKFPIDYYLSKIPIEYRDKIRLLEQYKGDKTRISFLNIKCGCELEYTLKVLIARHDLDTCRNCQKTKSLSFYLDKIKYQDNVKLLGTFIGQNTPVEYAYPKCGCVVKSTLKLLALYTDLDICQNCRPKKSLDAYKLQVPVPFELLGPYIGGETRVRIIHSDCGHSYDAVLNRMILKKKFDICSLCSMRAPADKCLEQIPEKYRGFVSFSEDYHGINTRVIFKYQCGHTQNLSLSSLINKSDYNFCAECIKKISYESYIQKIPSQYRDRICRIGEYSGFDTQVKYYNPCGHESKCMIGELSQRISFETCRRCIGTQQAKVFSDYLEKFDVDIRPRISLIDRFNGTSSKVKFKCPNCEEISILNLSSLLITKGHSCNLCPGYNLLSKQDMIDGLYPYLDSCKIISGYPGSRTSVIEGICRSCGKKETNYYFNLMQHYKYSGKAICSFCYSKHVQQDRLLEFVESLSIGMVNRNDNSTIISKTSGRHLELDIHCVDKKLAIEFNGLIWHSERYKKEINYHFEKTKLCQDAGIVLLHIWEDRFKEKPEVCHSLIKSKLGLLQNRIYARKTTILELSKKQIKEFFDDNHIDGNVSCITGWGLFYQNNLVQAISVRKANKQNKKYSGYLEIARSATLIDHLVVGGESKLLNQVELYARGKFEGILNYVSCDFGGIVKPKWKFDYKGITDVSYFYTDGNKRISRQRLQKRKPGQSEKELAEELGLFRVNASPNLVYVFEF